MLLTKGLYGAHPGGGPGVARLEAPFGLHYGQMNGGEFGHNSGWYNAFGQKLGYGDLSKADVLRIQQNLPIHEIFITMSERNSFWDFVTQIGIIGSMSSADATIEEPGVDYVADHARFVITRDVIYWADKYSRAGGLKEYQGLTLQVVDAKRVRYLMEEACKLIKAEGVV